MLVPASVGRIRIFRANYFSIKSVSYVSAAEHVRNNLHRKFHFISTFSFSAGVSRLWEPHTAVGVDAHTTTGLETGATGCFFAGLGNWE